MGLKADEVNETSVLLPYAAICYKYVALTVDKWNVSTERRRNNADMIKLKSSEKMYPSATLSTINPTRTDSG
jgi:hypothetical protein